MGEFNKNLSNKEGNDISSSLFESFKADYQKDKKNDVVRHSLIKNPISEVVYDNKNEPDAGFIFSNEIKTLPATNQKASGRCWIFAGLNVLREIIAKKLNLKSFELSQNFVAFYDKLEKANYALTSVIDLIDNEHDERVLMHVLTNGVGDGGQWDMFRNLVVKYGICPKSNFNETFQSANTMESRNLLNTNIRKFAAEAKKLANEGKKDEIFALKNQYLAKFYNFLTNSFGVPPTEFDFEYYDKDDKYHIEKGLTPKAFFDKYIGNEIEEYVSIINSPTKDKLFFKSYTVAYLNNVVEGKQITHLNLPMERIKELIELQINDGNIVWFGSDVGFYRDRKAGLWDDLSYDYETSFGLDFKFNKEDMLDFHASVMNHAMCLTGYNKKNGVTNRYKVENSWGEDVGNKGYYIMSSSWFDAFVYQAVILKKYLTEEELKAYNEEPTVLCPWDPMGTLAD